jgi:hypothetical protein
MICRVMKATTFSRLLEGMMRYRYMEFPLA